jgi:hypothetical protein
VQAEDLSPHLEVAMNVIAILINLINAYKTYASVILTIISGLGMILSKQYGEGLSEVFQGFVILFSGASVASLRHDMVSGPVDTPDAPAN